MHLDDSGSFSPPVKRRVRRRQSTANVECAAPLFEAVISKLSALRLDTIMAVATDVCALGLVIPRDQLPALDLGPIGLRVVVVSRGRPA